MKHERCKCCFSTYKVFEYTPAALRERILGHVMMHHPSPDDMISSLSKEGFRVEDIKREATRLWDAKKLGLTTEKCWVASVIVA